MISHQVKEVLGLFVELLVSIVRVDVASLTDSNDMRVLTKGFVCHWTVILTFVVLVESQLDEITLLHGLASERVLAVFTEIGHDIQKVEDNAIVCRIGVSEW